MDLTRGETVSLSNLGGGAAVEKFNDELVEVLRNIQDPNTSPTTAKGANVYTMDHNKTMEEGK